jgi:5'(3')-deoxyribonucleotidase
MTVIFSPVKIYPARVMNRIAIDLDEVLVPFLRPLANYHRRELPKGKHPYVFRQVFDCTFEEAQELIYDYYKSPEFLFTKPIIGSQRVMATFRRQVNKMYIVTGRQEACREQTELWVERHFPGIFDDVILTNSYTEHEISKVDICRALAIGCIIDDSHETCEQCWDNNILAVNFVGDGEDIYPWCEETQHSMNGWLDVNFSPVIF